MRIARRALLAASLATPAVAQALRTIRLIVPFAPGGGSDTLARLLAPALGAALGGASVVVENRAGAGSQIGAEAVMRSAPDGTTLLLGDTPLVTIPALQAAAGRPVPFQAAVDFTPIAAIAAAPALILVAQNAPWRDTREMLAAARARPGTINVASGGVATSTHLMIELLQLRSGVQVTHVPYRGTGAAIQDLLSGQVQAMIQAMATAAPLVAAGQMRVIGVAADHRLAELPDAPTLREQGIDLVSAFWWGVLGPPGMAAPLVDTLSTALQAAMASESVSSRLPTLGLERLTLGPTPFRDMLAAETARWRDVVQTAGIKPE
ncbi:tripartite tricarboxylate transporter substrate binding protein [Roseomonas terrae]|uniref:Tripartite tricarboxylate transporter substrate binding protein n=1 Tax=Neoroseomonas terrae TaxID=424799 RepID=A0ABS5EJY3_9PROT|nr:tripartite tricarboxylate transporter substrate binding protein [Neoroseomonas terrae]MBR0651331.1 tripartite tricarboxylate transporter substrate binding protein [Neoroseomonas terrae]